MTRSSNSSNTIDILKDILIIVLVLPTVGLFIVLALGRSIHEPTASIALAELGLWVAVLVGGVTMLYFDLREVKR